MGTVRHIKFRPLQLITDAVRQAEIKKKKKLRLGKLSGRGIMRSDNRISDKRVRNMRVSMKAVNKGPVTIRHLEG